jgi:hypothetical protein
MRSLLTLYTRCNVCIVRGTHVHVRYRQRVRRYASRQWCRGRRERLRPGRWQQLLRGVGGFSRSHFDGPWRVHRLQAGSRFPERTTLAPGQPAGMTNVVHGIAIARTHTTHP